MNGEEESDEMAWQDEQSYGLYWAKFGGRNIVREIGANYLLLDLSFSKDVFIF